MRQVIGSIGGLALATASLLVENLVPSDLLGWIGLASLPDEIRTWRGALMWSLGHFVLWVPLAIGVSIIFWAHWGKVMEKIRSPYGRLLMVAAVLLASFFATGLTTEATKSPAAPPADKAIAKVATPSQSLPPGSGAVSAGRDIHGNICTSGATCIFPPPKPAAPPPRAAQRNSAERLAPPWLTMACKEAREEQFEADASPELRPLLRRKFIIGNIFDDYYTMVSPKKPRMHDADAIAYMNKRLAEMHLDWRVTPENQEDLFGNVCLHCNISDHSKGVVINGGGGNIFDRSDIRASDTAVELNNTTQNSFIGSNINGDGPHLEYQPQPEPKECR